MAWRTKVGSARPVEHRSRDAADAYVDELRDRYRAGSTRVSLVRLYDPAGGVRLIDFGSEARHAAKALREVERVTTAKDRAVAEAVERWEAAIRRAASLGHAVEDVAAAAGLTPREVRAILRHRS